MDDDSTGILMFFIFFIMFVVGFYLLGVEKGHSDYLEKPCDQFTKSEYVKKIVPGKCYSKVTP